MTKGRIPSRAITTDEIDVIRVSLERAATAPEHRSLVAGLEQLRVIDICGCGCASVQFVEFDPENRPKPVADAIGRTSTGGVVGAIVWGTVDRVSGLEIYDLGAGQHDLTLPVPDSIERFQSSAGQSV